MKTIVMDTSNKYLVIGLYEDDLAIAKYQEEGNRRQSEDAIVRLQELLNQANWQLLKVDELVITIGPGSYTGARVALTIAKTLAAISNLKIKAVSSLHALAGDKQVVSVIDARSHKVFVGVYRNNQSIVDDRIMLIDNFQDFISNYPDYQIVGDSELVGYHSEEVDLCQNIYQASKAVAYLEDVDNLVPRYLKDVEAKKIC
ncbi:tRNA (adenosine(37)-N6)-threonylcarbamoyltransferase complex dimerization subunit type 1 TsaB [Thomasclavelia sp.]|uniref:tRNA (adenosine(37)-N6)-threonylcarbamoyltransferase complex dimerization subunit type 1 TsaB n=1 Tax=Thomasclavelia sp. TaxID=3025757 RepID=UPI0025F5A0D6|nr:tRNA (adenosine(37)-N6)-threonylcarbamoyltransferase complex dimerization subunit type 1 TsaB [Thomasclavelia sp.]